jgi:hypothetical protein
MSSTNRRTFLARGAAVPAVAALAGTAFADKASAATLPGWVPFDSFNLNEDVLGSLAAPATALSFPWKHFIGGHMGRLGTRTDMAVYEQYVNDLIAGAKASLTAIDPTPYFAKYGDNEWAAVKEYQNAQVAYASAPVIKKYTGVLAAADVYTASTAFVLLEAIRLDLGAGSQVHA